MSKAISEFTIKGAIENVVSHRFTDEGWSTILTSVPDEIELTIYVNLQELVSILCTPTKLDCLVLGFLYTEGIISKISDVARLEICQNMLMADVRLTNPEYRLPRQRVLTSGCGGGFGFKTQGERVNSNLVVTPTEVLNLMKQFQEQMELYRFCGGVHASALWDTKDLMVMAEDVGRHNTLDKIQGECLLRNLSIKDGILFTTGRISSEMVLKVAKMRVPVIISRSSPTWRAISLARDLDITLVGYARGNRLSVYSHPQRFGLKIERQID